MDNVVPKEYVPEIGVYGLAVYCVLCAHVRSSYTATFVARATIAKCLNCSLKTVDRSLAELVRVGLVACRSGKTEGVGTVYILLSPPAIPQGRKSVQTGEKKDVTNDTVIHQIKEGGTPKSQGGISPQSQGGGTSMPSPNRKKNTSTENNTSSSPAELFDPAPGVSKEPPMRKTITDEITRLWEIGNPDVKCEWVPLAFKRLKTLVESRPRWTTEQWLKCVRNRFSSDGINVGEAPEVFIPQLPKYIRSALNEYGKEAKEGGPSGSSRGDKNRAAVDQVVGELDDIIERSR
jgi:hypothetical protein